jgi:hypothetical protein
MSPQLMMLEVSVLRNLSKQRETAALETEEEEEEEERGSLQYIG